MKINRKVEVQVNAKVLKLHCKVCDNFTAYIHDENDKCIGGQDDGYVPKFMPEDHYGDYLCLNIDLDTGQVLNWKTPTVDQIEKFIGGGDDE